MDATIKSLLTKAWKNETADLAPGRHYIDEEFIVRVTGSVEKLDDELAAPTVSIPLIAALALFWEKAGIVRDKATRHAAGIVARGDDGLTSRRTERSRTESRTSTKR